MLDAIKSLFRSNVAETDDISTDDHHLAAAVLLVEAAVMDGTMDDDERATIDSVLQSHFDLSAAESGRLLELATAEQEASTHLHRHTLTIKDEFSESERLELIELLWEVVYADGQLHEYEANLLRRIGGLLYVTDRERGEARKRVVARLGVQ